MKKTLFIFLIFLTCNVFCNDQTIKWGWIGGSDEADNNNELKTFSHSTSGPVARQRASSWVDSKNNIWVFGGMKNGVILLNDLWKFDGNQWTLVKSFDSTATNPDAGQIGARQRSVTWVDSNDHLWIFGGDGHDVQDEIGYLCDIWSFDGEKWTWKGGIPIKGFIGNYGERGVGSPGNNPGGRAGSVGWINKDILYLFGGHSVGKEPEKISNHNDFWKYDPSNGEWTWFGGSDEPLGKSVYGTKGVEDEKNIPGARMNSAGFKIDNGTDVYFYLFGGTEYLVESEKNALTNDLWRYNLQTSKWSWVSGSNTPDQQSVYGNRGRATDTTVPGARENPSLFLNPVDLQLWLFGGQGRNGVPSAPQTGFLNDFWLYNFTHWTWMGGSTQLYQKGEYGTQGVQAADNMPGSRHYALSFSLVKRNNNDFSLSFWLFGGYGYDSKASVGFLNDLWNVTVPKVIIPPPPPFEFTNGIIIGMFLGGFFVIALACVMFGIIFYGLLNLYENNSKRYSSRVEDGEEDDMGNNFYKPEKQEEKLLEKL